MIQAQEKMTLAALSKRQERYEKQIEKRFRLYGTFANSLISNFKAMNKQVDAIQKLNRGLGESFAKSRRQIVDPEREVDFDISTKLLIEAVAKTSPFKASLKEAFSILDIKNIKDVFQEPIDTYSNKSPTPIPGFTVKAQERFVKFLATRDLRTTTKKLLMEFNYHAPSAQHIHG